MKQYLIYWCSPGHPGYPSNVLPAHEGLLQIRGSFSPTKLADLAASDFLLTFCPLSQKRLGEATPHFHCLNGQTIEAWKLMVLEKAILLLLFWFAIFEKLFYLYGFTTTISK